MKYIILLKGFLALTAGAVTINTCIITWGPKDLKRWVTENIYLASAINFIGLVLLLVIAIAIWERAERRTTAPTS